MFQRGEGGRVSCGYTRQTIGKGNTRMYKQTNKHVNIALLIVGRTKEEYVSFLETCKFNPWVFLVKLLEN